MTLKDDIYEACQNHDIYSILGTKKRVIVCPLPMHIHHNQTPSFSIFWRGDRQWWRCHGMCNTDGDVVDLIGYLRIPGYEKANPNYQRQALAMLDDKYEIKVVKPEKENRLDGGEWMDYLPPGKEVLEYAMGRGLIQETISKFSIGQALYKQSTYMTMPCFEEHKLVGIKFRNVESHSLKDRFTQLKGSRQGLFNFDAVNLKNDVVFVVKGEIPCMLMDQNGFLSCAPTGGEGGWSEKWRTALAFARKIVVGDNDDAGRKLGRIRAAYLDAALVFPPEQFKDWDEFLLADKAECIRITEKWKKQYQEAW